MASVASHTSISDNLPRSHDGTIRAKTPSAMLADLAHAIFLAHGFEVNETGTPSSMSGRTFVHASSDIRYLFHPIDFGDCLVLHVRCGNSPKILKLSLLPNHFVLLVGDSPNSGQALFQPLGSLFNVRFDEAICRIETHLIFAAVPSLRPPAHVANPFADLPPPIVQAILALLSTPDLRAAAGTSRVGRTVCSEQWRSRPPHLRLTTNTLNPCLPPRGVNVSRAGFELPWGAFPDSLRTPVFDPYQPKINDGLNDEFWSFTTGGIRPGPVLPGVRLGPNHPYGLFDFYG